MDHIYILIDSTFNTIIAFNEHRFLLYEYVEEHNIKNYEIIKVMNVTQI